MTTRVSLFRAALLMSALAAPAMLHAQTAPQEAEPPANAPAPEDASLQTVSQAELNATATDSEIALLRAQLEAVQAQLDELKKQTVKAMPVWKGAPQSVDADEGWAFKVRGRLMLDTGIAGAPENYVANRNLGGWNTRFRRARLGVEGTVPGGFGYKAEMDFANGVVGFGDVVGIYAPKNSRVEVTLGNHETLNGMEQITSSRWSSFIERAQVNDAFNNTRRLGLSVASWSKDNTLRASAGLFSGHSIDASLNNDGWIAAGRVTYTPFALGGFVHLGVNAQFREFQSNDAGAASVATGAPSTNQIARYRARPFLQLTDVRFVDTGAFAAKSDVVLGAELYGVFKSLHIGGEAQWTKVDAYRPGTIALGRDAFTGGSVVTPSRDPEFFGGHFEVGYFFTGETRGYKNGLWDRTKVLHPVGKGGSGALQGILRADYLNLNSGGALRSAATTNTATGVIVAPGASAAGRGGKQLGLLAGLTWIPTDYVRFLLNYVHTNVEGGPLQATVNPTSTAPIWERSFSTNSVALRAQIDW